METYLEFSANHPILVTLLVFSFFLLVFSELRRKASGIMNVEPADAVKLINADAVVIDIRSNESFSRGHIVNAKNIPSDELSAQGDKMKKYGERPILAVCDAGMLSSRAVANLRKAGMDNVYGLKGGITAWTQELTARVSG